MQGLKRAGWFCLLTFGLSWSMAAVVYMIFKKPSVMVMTVLGLFYMLMPALSAVVLQKFVFREPLKAMLGISFRFNRWWVVAWVLPAIIAIAALGCGLLVPGVSWAWEINRLLPAMVERLGQQLTPEQVTAMEQQIKAIPVHPFWLGLLQGLLAGITVNAVFGLGEELGWRSFLQKQLQGLGFWRSSLLIGLIWGIWHAPMVLLGLNYPQHPQIGIFYMTYFTILLAPLLAYVRVKCRSVIGAAIFHGSLNGTAGLAIITLNGGSDLSVGITGAAGFAALAAANLLVWAFDRWLAKEPVIPGFRNAL